MDDSTGGRRRRSRSGARGRWVTIFLGAVAAVSAIAWLTTRADEPTSATSATAAPEASPAAAAAGGVCPSGKTLYVSADGSSQNDGSRERPLDLTTALSAQGPAKPCDLIWMRGGTYAGSFVSAISGRDGSPILVRQALGERATIDSAGSELPTLQVNGSYTWFQDLEITNSHPLRTSTQTAGWPSDLKRASGVVARGSHLKFINLVVHDVTRGFEIGSESVDTEVYGSIVYFNGWEGPNQASNGHGIDTRNRVGVRRLIDNIVFNQYSHGIIAYASETDPTHNMRVEGNILFNNGALSRGGAERDLLIGGGTVAQKPAILNNVTYGKAQASIGYGAGCTGGLITDNYFAAQFVLDRCEAEVKGNTFIAAPAAFLKLYPGNTYEPTQPTATVVRVRPNQYDRGRANVVVINSANQPQVSLDLSQAGLQDGASFAVRDAQDFYGPPVLEGVYSQGKPVSLPMAARAPAKPVGSTPATPSHTLPGFGAFVVVPTTK